MDITGGSVFVTFALLWPKRLMETIWLTVSGGSALHGGKAVHSMMEEAAHITADQEAGSQMGSRQG